MWGVSGTGLRTILSLFLMINGVLLVQAEGTIVGENNLQNLNGQTVEMLSHSFLLSEEKHDGYPSYEKY